MSKTSARKATTITTIPNDPISICGLLEGQLDAAAVKLICDGGVLSLHREGGVPDAIQKLEARYAFTEFERIKDTMHLTSLEDEELGNAVYGAAAQREELAYLLGVAVGRRLGARPFRAGARR